MNHNRRRGGAALVVAALVVTLSGCGGDTPRTTNEPIIGAPGQPVPSAAPSNEVTGAADRAAILEQVFGAQAPFTGPAADKFGADNVMTAYKYLVTFSLDNGFTETLMTPKAKFRPVDFDFIKPYLGKKAQDDWDASVTAALAGDEKAKTNINVMTLWNVDIPGYTLKADDAVRDQKWSPENTTVDGNRLIMRMNVSADVILVKDGKDHASTVTRDLTYALVPPGVPGIPWQIDGWTGSYSSTNIRPL